MKILDLAVRRTLEVVALLLGGLLVLVTLVFAVHTVVEPGCAVDVDHADGVLATRVLAGGWGVLDLLLAAVMGTWFVRTPDDGWARVVVALALPVAVVALWIGFGGLHSLVVEGLDAGPGSSACF